ncbi:hypothetical protein AYO21_00989 [Fonsecaea monophora]|uniref:Uncharacterized protein n=1 Tax=Fonsecaea monophora TaxID=254056 RepID=A0A177FMW0_9EURO|nr:hypothetical protein AYO21_00989 [Fonsecaea monophora]OAG45026.1 hypothetical protein AYO21_00989 [Fonsecaea monophora]
MRPSEDHAASDLHTLPSTLSVQLPASQIPHAVSQSGAHSADREALRELFRSSSSVRGYRTASLPSGSNLYREPSLDTDFKFGPQDQHRKQSSRIEQLGNHIKQKLSESRLSKSSSRPQMISELTPHDTTRRDNAQLGMNAPEGTLSQRSTGLLELLMSRTASEGGYDSDAKSIQTAALKASDGTIKLSPSRVLSLSSPDSIQLVTTDCTPPSPASIRTLMDTHIRSENSKASSTSSTSSNASFINVVQGQRDESPLGSSKQPGKLAADVTIELTHGTKSKTMPPSTDPDTRGHDLLTPSSLKDCSESVAMLKALEGTDSAAKRESQISNATGPRASLMSELDPSLLGFISKYGERSSVEILERMSGDNAVAFVRKSNSLAMADMDPFDVSKPGREGISRKDLSSLADSDRSSVHLYNMRISQRLASPSFITSGRPNTSHTTTARTPRGNSLDFRPSTSQTSVAGRVGSLITVEHNRRPSDPETKRLFEGDLVRRRTCFSRGPGASPIHANTFGKSKSLTGTEDASSFYWSDSEFEDVGPPRRSTRKGNPNSIAIGGRSESISLPIWSSSASIGNLSVAEESAWFSRKRSENHQAIEEEGRSVRFTKRNRSVSMPDRSNLDYYLPRGVNSQQVQHSTEANEAMSEINTDLILEARNEKLTEINVQAIRDAHNERMSEIEPATNGDTTAARQGPCNQKSLATSHPRRALPFSRMSVTARPSRSEDGDAARSIYDGPNKLHESATDMWQRSFKRAMEEPERDTMSGFLTSPKFDRDGRRRSTRSSVSAAQLSHQSQQTPEEEADSNTLREIKVRNGSSSVEKQRRLQICVKKPDPLPCVNPRRSITNVDVGRETPVNLPAKKTSRKKSILDIGRRFTVVGASSESDGASGASTPLKDIFGLWGRFPSHTRQERCASAGHKDGVATRDFALDYQDENTSSTTPRTPWARPTPTRALHTPGSWRMLQFSKQDGEEKARTKRIRGTQSLGIRHSKSRKGLAGRWKRLYRSSSTEFRAYAHTHGHRSSISVGASVGYPELEVIAGDERRFDGCGAFDWRPDMDGSAETSHLQELQVVNRMPDRPPEPLDTQPWTRMYQDCVGSLSALKSDPNMKLGGLAEVSTGLYDRHVTSDSVQSAGLRDSTVDFEHQLGQEHETVKRKLIGKIESMDQSEERFDVHARPTAEG